MKEKKRIQEETAEEFFEETIQEAKDAARKKQKALKSIHEKGSYQMINIINEMDDRFIIDKEDGKGFWNSLRCLIFDENDFTEHVLYTFILANYPNADIGVLKGTKEVEKFQDALEEVLNFVKKNKGWLKK